MATQNGAYGFGVSEHRDAEARVGGVAPRSISLHPLRVGAPKGALAKRVLLVEDDVLFREGLALLLEWRAGLRSVQAGSLEEAGRALGQGAGRDGGGAIGAAIVDADLRDGRGIELIERLRGAEPRVPIVALTDGRDSGRCARALRAGAQEAIGMREPGAIEGIVGAVRRLSGDATKPRPPGGLPSGSTL